MNQTTFLRDYQPWPFNLTETKLAFDLREGHALVRADLRFDGDGERKDLRLPGQGLTLEGVAVDGRELSGNEFHVDEAALTIHDAPPRCVVTVRTRIDAESNKELMGLYKSGATFCTQCEPEGFRRIVYHPDRPDVLSRFTTAITADAEAFPTLLSNGNLVADATEDGRRTVVWEDPFPKPSYLFALVAGNLAVLKDEFQTRSGRRVALRFYAEPRHRDQCEYALGALKRAMRWDEERFGREYDLDVFMVVAVEDFNAGAMENKGLNIFNTSCVLASPDTATDAAHQRVEAVIAHEYFHNWSGNRVTCRDWFQLSLKEGFTVFRDAEFSADMNSRAVKRIEDAEFLRNVQFAEDAGPLAHPVRPQSYEKIDNFYTPTVYEKGSEVIRMMHALLGPGPFRRGSDLYFRRHDGTAVTTEDFVAAMEDASGVELGQFRLWYEQAGTPRLQVREARDEDGLALTITQSCPPTPGQPKKAPFHIPLAIGLVGENGSELLAGDDVALTSNARLDAADAGTRIVHVKERVTTLRFANAPATARVSFLRGFSAPVKVDYPRTPKDLRFLAANDADGFARWDAARSLLIDAMRRADEDDASPLDAEVEGMFEALLAAAANAPNDGETKPLLVWAMTPPSAQYLLDLHPGTDILRWWRLRDALLGQLSERFQDAWLALHEANAASGPYQPDGPSFARRALKNHALAMHARSAAGGPALLEAQFRQADNLTDRAAAFAAFLNSEQVEEPRRQRMCDAFHAAWRHEALLVDLWLRVQAGSERPDALRRVRALERHAAFDIEKPNRVRALFGAFAANTRNFHAEDGAGYAFFGDRVAMLDAINPQVAARMATPLTRWQRFDPKRRRLMRSALERLAEGQLSPELREVVSKGLA